MAINTRPDQYAIGKGRFYFAPNLPIGGLDAYRFIGNVSAFTLTPKVDTLTHTSSLSGLNVEDRNIVVSQTLDLAFTTDNVSVENVALWAGGSVDTVTQTSVTGSTQTIAAPKLGYVYVIGVSSAAPAGLKDITVTSVMQSTTTLVAGTDYVVNARAGTISFPTTGAAVAGTPVTVTYSVAAKTSSVINTRNNVVSGAVRFVSDNPITDPVLGKLDSEYFLPYVRLSASGDFALIGTEWQSFAFDGSVLQQTDVLGNPIPQMTITPLTAPTS